MVVYVLLHTLVNVPVQADQRRYARQKAVRQTLAEEERQAQWALEVIKRQNTEKTRQQVEPALSRYPAITLCSSLISIRPPRYIIIAYLKLNTRIGLHDFEKATFIFCQRPLLPTIRHLSAITSPQRRGAKGNSF